MIHSLMKPVVDPQLLREQASFRQGRSSTDQVALLTQDIEDSLLDKEKAGVVLLDLTAAYDTIWHRRLHLKVLRTIQRSAYGEFRHRDAVKPQLHPTDQ